MSTVLPLDYGTNGATAPPTTPPATEPEKRKRIFPRTRKRRLQIEPETVVRSVMRRAREIMDDGNRAKWLSDRLARYAKYRGWLSEKSFPWPGASNVHIPLLQIGELRTNAGLHNVVMTLRPLMTAKATQRANIDKEQKITDLLDVQLFLDPGPEAAERRMGDYVSSFLQDGNAVAYTPWVRTTDSVHSVRYVAPPPPGEAMVDYLPAKMATWFKNAQPPELDEKVDNLFHVTFQDGGTEREAEITVTEDDKGVLECVIRKDATIYDGPVMLPIDQGSLLVPTRCTNLQAPSAWNPTGAPYVMIQLTYRLDEIRRLQKAGDFNWLDDEGLEKIEAAARRDGGLAQPDRPGEELERQKDALEGREHQGETSTDDEDIGHLGVDLLLCFDRWDVDGDGLSEDVFWTIARDAEVLCEARLLTERWPSDRPYRPLAEAVAIPVPGRWYGISLLELGESMYDLIKGTFDMGFDGYTMATIPFFLYSATSKMAEDITPMAPGQGIRTPGNPKDTVLFPNMPQRDIGGMLGIVGLATQFYERVMMQGDLQLGRIPQGKASALRTFGTTSAILQQGDVRADQLLLRLFGGLRQVARNYHRMNRYFLPEGKEFRLLGWDGLPEQGYRTVTADDIDADVDFDFRPDFLLSNPATLSQALQSVMSVVVTPMMFQMRATTPTHVYRLVKDFIRSMRLDPKLYIMPPTPGGQPILASEAIAAIMDGRLPEGTPMEGAEAHLKALFEWQTQESQHEVRNPMDPTHTEKLTVTAMNALSPERVQLLRAWMQQIAQQAQVDKHAAAAAQFQQAQQGGGMPGQEGMDTTAQPVDVGTGEPVPGVQDGGTNA